jgi:hypothetical protein
MSIMPLRRAIRSTIGFLSLLAFVLSGCSRAVTVPPRELAPASQWHGRYRIKTTTAEFTARHFAVTDSTVVIRELAGSDKRYGDAELPITVPVQDVKSVERLDVDEGKTFVVVVLAAVFAGLIIGLSTWEGPALD